MNKITKEDFGHEPITESGYYLFRRNKTGAIHVGHVDTIFDTVEILGNVSLGFNEQIFTEFAKRMHEFFTWYRIPCEYKDT